MGNGVRSLFGFFFFKDNAFTLIAGIAGLIGFLPFNFPKARVFMGDVGSIFRGENLMQAHRSHLYQYLSNELKLPHWKVTLLYAVVQLCFGVIAVGAYQKGLVIQLILLLSFSVVFLVSYNLVKTMKPRLSGP